MYIRVEWIPKKWTIDKAGQPIAAFWYGLSNNWKVFSKILMSFTAPRGLKLPKIEIFHENGLFSVIIFYNQLVACPVIFYWKELLKLRRMVYYLSKSVHIWWTCNRFNPNPYFTTFHKDKIGQIFITFLSFQLFEHVICHFIPFYTTF